MGSKLRLLGDQRPVYQTVSQRYHRRGHGVSGITNFCEYPKITYHMVSAHQQANKATASSVAPFLNPVL